VGCGRPFGLSALPLPAKWYHPAGKGGDGGVIFSKGDNMAVNITWDYKSVRVLAGISSDVRQKLLQHEAQEGWVYVGTVPIDDDDHLVFKKSSDRPGIAVI
jgi:hypothetical protein